MQNSELFMHFAEIAGIFVGFGALISIRREAASDDYEVSLIRMIVWGGVVVVVAALVPVMLGEYGVAGHRLWVTSSILFLILWWGGSTILDRLNPERARLVAAYTRGERMRVETPAVFIWLPMNAALVLILVGPFPDQEPALYLTAVALNLLMDALLLLYLAYQQGRPQAVGESSNTSSDEPSSR